MIPAADTHTAIYLSLLSLVVSHRGADPSCPGSPWKCVHSCDTHGPTGSSREAAILERISLPAARRRSATVEIVHIPFDERKSGERHSD